MTPTPIGRTVLVRVLPEKPRSRFEVEGLAPENMTRRCEIVAVGGKCRYSEVGQVVVARTTLGHIVGDLVLLPEVACLAKVEG